MGRIRKFKRGNKFAQQRREREQNKLTAAKENSDGDRKSYKEIIRENPDFDKFYKAQNIVPDSEWDTFLSYLKKDLPTAFRISACSKSEAKALLEIIEGQFFKDLINVDSTENGEERKKPFCLPWYPNRLGWQLQISRKDIRRSETYFRLHNFLISETATGTVSRQEAVSMIPPLLLDIKPHHKVIDMCAAPGSKTAQLIEMMHSEEGKLPEGFVVANDIDNSRCYMLVHQAKRLNSPCIVITNHDSACMPNITVTNKDGSKGILKYDRVLCDVPCTGDGTLRKNPDIWMKWNTANGDNLHGVQLRILSRGVELLTVGGRLVYSTCSLNPVENEAVIHRILVNAKGTLKLIDVSDKLPGLVYSKGVSSWLPASRDVVMYEKFDDVPEKWTTQVRPQMFPPNPVDAPQFHLDRCIRILPHHQDTGGFFVAVLEKIAPLPWESSKTTKEVIKCDDEVETSAEVKYIPNSGPERKRRKIQGYREDPFVFFADDEPVWPSIRDFFGIDSRLQSSCLLTRCVVGKKKNIYFVSPAVQDIVMNNQKKIKLINTGVKTFARWDNKSEGCCFRLAQEGLQSIVPFIGEQRRIRLSKSDLLTLLSNDDPKFPPETTILEEETQQRLSHISQGSCVLEYRGNDGLNLDMVGWRGVRSLRAYVPLSDCIHFIRILGGDTSKFDKNKFKKEEESIENEETRTDTL
uniref:tRNA (cytosine(34)-C(5))-methyltransferase n=2 Tax=Clastoptera arizonana TaxID=38151 RepID=A0A1B6DIS1_9HEMI